MCTEYDNMQYCSLIGGYCYTPNECNYCSEYEEKEKNTNSYESEDKNNKLEKKVIKLKRFLNSLYGGQFI